MTEPPWYFKGFHTHCWHQMDITLDWETVRMTCCRCDDRYIGPSYGRRINWFQSEQKFHGPYVPPETPWVYV